MQSNFIEIGTVQALYRYPVKSMAGEALAQAHLYWYGLDGDRRYAFIRGDNRSGFPWLTGRQVAEMLRYRPLYDNPDDPLNSDLKVQTPDGRLLPIHAAELKTELAGAYGHDVDLIHIKRGIYDTMPVSVMSLATARALNERVETAVDVRRFRQNIILDTFTDEPFAEEAWLDGVLQFGEGIDAPRIRLNQRIPRCRMINLDPDTAESDPSVLKVVAQNRDNCVGIGCSPEKIGRLRVGDVVRLTI